MVAAVIGVRRCRSAQPPSNSNTIFEASRTRYWTPGVFEASISRSRYARAYSAGGTEARAMALRDAAAHLLAGSGQCLVLAQGHERIDRGGARGGDEAGRQRRDE